MSDFTEVQEKFLDLIFKKEYMNDMEQAAIDAGYSPNTQIHNILIPLKEEIIRRTDMLLARRLPKTIAKIDEVMDEPSKKGAKTLLETCWGILDRAGVTKKERVEVEHKAASGIFIIPEKKTN